MTATAEPRIDHDGGPAWEPRGHPVRWAAGVVTLVAVTMLTSIWFGALTPRVDATPREWGVEVGSSPAEPYVVLDVTNDAHAPVRLVAAGESLPGLELTSAELTTGERLSDRHTVTLDPGDRVSVTLRYRVTSCADVRAVPPPIPLVLRTPVGLTRTVDGPRSLAPEGSVSLVAWTHELVSRSC
jgi:hypothetical protein